MAYTINKTNGNPITVADNVVDSTYSVQLVGKNRTNYGATINQNFFRLMEHFSSGSAPSSPQSGQVWFDSTYSTLKVWDGAYWKPLSGIATATPSSPVSGDLWFDTVNQQLKVYASSIWVAINSGIAGGGTNGAITETVIDSSTVSHYVSSLYASGVRVAMLSKEPVTGITGFTGFSNLVAGINYNTSISTSTVNGNVVGATAVFSGNITAGNINAVSGILSVTGNANVGNIGAINANLSALTVSGNINSGNIIIANGSNISGTVGGFAVGYRDQPPMAGGNIILSATDAGKHYYSSTGDIQTLTIPSQANVPMPVGTVIRVIHNNANGYVIIQTQSPVTLKLALLGLTGNRAVGSYGDATITKIESDVWWISGTNIS